VSASPSVYSKRSLIVPVYIPSLLFSAGEMSIIPIIPASAERLGADIPTAGFIAGLVMLGTLLADIPAAKLVDRLGERRAMILASLGAGLGILLALTAVNVWMIGLGVMMMGAGVAVFSLARLAWMAEHVPLDQRARALAILGGMFRAGSFVGPSLGAWVIHSSGVVAVYALASTLSVAAAAVLFATRSGRLNDTVVAPEANTWSIAKRESNKLFTVGLGSTMLAMLRTIRSVGLPLWALYMHLDPALAVLYIGLANAVDFGLFYTSGQVMDRFGRRYAAVPTLLLLGVSMCFVPAATTPTMFLLVAIGMSIANGLGSGVIMVLGADLAPKDARSEFLAAYRLLTDAGQAAAPMVLSGLTVVVGLGAAFVSLGSLGFIGAFLMFRFIPRFTVVAPEPTTSPTN
jgi:MFS family permease